MKKKLLTVSVALLIVVLAIAMIACGEKDPEFEVPSDLSVAYGLTLGDLPLPEGFTWQDELTTSVGEVGQNTFLVTFTPEDTDKYKTVTDIEVTITVTKADPTYTVPQNLTATYGQTLANVALPAGFAWKDASASVGNAGKKTFAASFTPTDLTKYNVVGTVNLTVTVNKAPAVINTQNVNLAFTYDGAEKSIAGATGTGAITYENNAFTDAGAYAIKVLCAESDNYLAGETTVTATVAKAAAIIDTQNVVLSFEYDGTEKSISGATGTGAITYENNAFTEVGSHDIVIKCAESDNYLAGETTVTATVTQKEVAGLTLPDGTFTYDGTAKSLQVVGELPEGVSVEYTNNGKINAGTYEVTAHFVADDDKYSLPDDLTATLTINKADYDMKGVSLGNGQFTYDGTAKSLQITGGLPEGVSVEYANNGKIDAGTYAVTATFTGDATNYNAIENLTATLTIAKLTATIEWTETEVIYDGEGHLPLGTITNKARETDEVGVTIHSDPGYAVGGHAWATNLELTGKDAINYKLDDDEIATLFIAAATMTDVSVAQTGSLTYTGETQQATVNAVATTVDGASVTFTYKKPGDETYVESIPAYVNAGEYEVWYKASAENHRDEYNSFTITIGKADAFLNTTGTVRDYTYDGAKHMITGLTQVSGPFTYTVNEVPCDGYIDAGTYPITVNVEETTNYFGGTWTLYLSIEKANLTVTAENKAVTYGDAAPEYTATITGFPNNEDESVLDGELAFTCAYVIGDAAGTYDVVPSGLTAENYAFIFVNGTLTVGKRTAIIDWSNTNVTYDGSEHLPTGTITNKYGEDVVGVAINNQTPCVNVGGYAWMSTLYLTGAAKDNYKLDANERADLTITKASLNIDWSNTEVSYTGNAQSLPTGTITNAIEGEDVGVAIDDDTPYVYPGEYTWTFEDLFLTGGDKDNYAIDADESVTLTINLADLDYESVKQTGTLTYTGLPQTPTVSAQVVAVDGQEVPFLYTADFENDPYVADLPSFTEAGKHTVYYKTQPQYHYETCGAFYITIDKAPLTVKADDKEMVKGGDAPTFTASCIGLLNGDTAEVLIGGEIGFSCVYEAETAGTYDIVIVPNGVYCENYEVTFTNGTLTVRKPVSPNAESIEAPTGITATYGDTLADVELPADWYWIDDESTFVGDVGEREFDARLVSEEYDDVIRTVTVTVGKADPGAFELNVIESPAHYVLSGITPPEHWSWNTPAEELTHGSNEVVANFEGDDNHKAKAGVTVLVTLYTPNPGLSFKADLSKEYDGNELCVNVNTDIEFAEGVYTPGNETFYVSYRLLPDGVFGPVAPTEPGEYEVRVTVTGINPWFNNGSVTETFSITAGEGYCEFYEDEYTERVGLLPYDDESYVAAGYRPKANAPVYYYKLSGASDETYTLTPPMIPGTYTVKAVTTENEYYQAASDTCTLILTVGEIICLYQDTTNDRTITFNTETGDDDIYFAYVYDGILTAEEVLESEIAEYCEAYELTKGLYEVWPRNGDEKIGVYACDVEHGTASPFDAGTPMYYTYVLTEAISHDGYDTSTLVFSQKNDEQYAIVYAGEWDGESTLTGYLWIESTFWRVENDVLSMKAMEGESVTAFDMPEEGMYVSRRLGNIRWILYPYKDFPMAGPETYVVCEADGTNIMVRYIGELEEDDLATAPYVLGDKYEWGYDADGKLLYMPYYAGIYYIGYFDEEDEFNAFLISRPKLYASYYQYNSEPDSWTTVTMIFENSAGATFQYAVRESEEGAGPLPAYTYAEMLALKAEEKLETGNSWSINVSGTVPVITVSDETLNFDYGVPYNMYLVSGILTPYLCEDWYYNIVRGNNSDGYVYSLFITIDEDNTILHTDIIHGMKDTYFDADTVLRVGGMGHLLNSWRFIDEEHSYLIDDSNTIFALNGREATIAMGEILYVVHVPAEQQWETAVTITFNSLEIDGRENRMAYRYEGMLTAEQVAKQTPDMMYVWEYVDGESNLIEVENHYFFLLDEQEGTLTMTVGEPQYFCYYPDGDLTFGFFTLGDHTNISFLYAGELTLNDLSDNLKYESCCGDWEYDESINAIFSTESCVLYDEEEKAWYAADGAWKYVYFDEGDGRTIAFFRNSLNYGSLYFIEDKITFDALSELAPEALGYEGDWRYLACDVIQIYDGPAYAVDNKTGTAAALVATEWVYFLPCSESETYGFGIFGETDLQLCLSVDAELDLEGLATYDLSDVWCVGSWRMDGEIIVLCTEWGYDEILIVDEETGEVDYALFPGEPQ